MKNNTTTNTSAITIRFNKEQGGIEVQFPREMNLSSAQVRQLKEECSLIWKRTGGYWYTRYSAEKWEAIKNCEIFDGCKFPTPSKSLVETAAEKTAEVEKRREQKKAEREALKAQKKKTTSAELDELKSEMADMKQMFMLMMQKMNGETPAPSELNK